MVEYCIRMVLDKGEDLNLSQLVFGNENKPKLFSRIDDALKFSSKFRGSFGGWSIEVCEYLGESSQAHEFYMHGSYKIGKILERNNFTINAALFYDI